jgi:hypothetical protein
MIIQNWLEIHLQNKIYSMSITRKLKIHLSAKSVEPFSQPWINVLGILWIIVKTKGIVKSVLKLLPGEIISRTSVITFFLFAIVNSEYESPDRFDCTNFVLLKYLYDESHVNKHENQRLYSKTIIPLPPL